MSPYEIGDCFWYIHEKERGIIQKDIIQIIERKQVSTNLYRYKIRILWMNLEKPLWEWKDVWLDLDNTRYPMIKAEDKEVVTYIL